MKLRKQRNRTRLTHRTLVILFVLSLACGLATPLLSFGHSSTRGEPRIAEFAQFECTDGHSSLRIAKVTHGLVGTLRIPEHSGPIFMNCDAIKIRGDWRKFSCLDPKDGLHALVERDRKTKRLYTELTITREFGSDESEYAHVFECEDRS